MATPAGSPAAGAAPRRSHGWPASTGPRPPAAPERRSPYVTDIDGEIFQHLEYFPFGESFVEEQSNTQRTPYLFTAKELDEDTQLYYFGARYYDPRTSVWQSADPILGDYLKGSPNNGVFTSANLNLYGYAWNKPVKLIDPDGRSPISVLVKRVANLGVKKGIRSYADKQIRNRLGRYMTKDQMREFAGDLAEVLGTMDSAWWEIGIELLPLVGDIYGGTKLGKQVLKTYDKLQDLENKWVGKIADSLPDSQKKKFIRNMRNRGVSDAKADIRMQRKHGKSDEIFEGREGHHGDSVSHRRDRASDPRNIDFVDRKTHLERHEGNFQTKTKERTNIERLD